MRTEVERISPHSLCKSVQDRRQYRRLCLQNGLRVCIVQREPEPDDSDSDSDSGSSCSSQDSSSGDKKPAALALGVTVGHFYDPAEFPGLAHLLEHMLFLDRAPNENAWEQFLSEHGGWSNATTSEETTLYFYEIHPDYLSESIQRFVSLFLLDPPLYPEAIEREVQAVESEFQEGLLVDEHRLTQIMCHISEPGHPFQKFGWGNLKSLYTGASATEIAAALRRFHSDYYRAENMNLVIMVSDDLDQVEADVIEQFGAVRSGSIPKLIASSGPPFNMEASKPHLIEVVPVKETYSLELVFQLPSLLSSYAAQPCGYWGEVLGDEGPGSAAHILRERGLASELKAGLGQEQTYQNSLFSLFTIQVTLTKSGHSEWKEVLRILFAYINVCVGSGPQRHLWDQYAQMASASFTWAEPKEPAETVEELAYALQRYDWDHIVSGPYLWERYEPELIMSIGNQLIPQNALIFIMAPFGDQNRVYSDSDYNGDCAPSRVCSDSYSSKLSTLDAVLSKECVNDSDGLEIGVSKVLLFDDTDVTLCNDCHIEPWFGTKFRTSWLSAKFISALSNVRDSALSLPVRSSLVPNAFDIVDRHVPSTPSQPHVSFVNDRVRVWHLVERKHITPRAHVTLRFYAGVCYSSPLTAVASRLLIMLLEDALGTFLYEGEVADLAMSMRATRRALEFQAEGFSDRLFEFVRHVLCDHPKSLRLIVLQQDRFQLVKERLQIAWRSAFYAPTDQASYERLRVLQSPKFSIESLRAALDEVALDDVVVTLDKIRASAFIEAFLHGNVSVADASQFTNAICQSWGARSAASDSQTVPVVRLIPAGTTLTWSRPSFNPLEVNSAHVSYYQFGPDSVRDRACLRFLQRISSENCFDSLRTRSQLGYSVSVHYLNTDGILGIVIEVISATHSPFDCEAAIEAWIRDELYALIDSMPDDVFDNHIEGFIMDIEAQDYNLGSKHDRLWDEIASHNHVFDRIEEETSVIEQIERKELLAITDRLFKPETRSKLSTHVVAPKSASSSTFNESIEPLLQLSQFSPKIDLPAY